MPTATVYAGDAQRPKEWIERGTRGDRGYRYFQTDTADLDAAVFSTGLPVIGAPYSVGRPTLRLVSLRPERLGLNSLVLAEYESNGQSVGGTQLAERPILLNQAVAWFEPTSNAQTIIADINGNALHQPVTIEVGGEVLVVQVAKSTYTWYPDWLAIRDTLNSNTIAMRNWRNLPFNTTYTFAAGTLLAQSVRDTPIQGYTDDGTAFVLVEFRFLAASANGQKVIQRKQDQNGNPTGTPTTFDIRTSTTWDLTNLWNAAL